MRLIRWLGIALTSVLVLLAVMVSNASASACYIQQINYFSDATCGTNLVGVYQYDCWYRLVHYWGDVTPHYEWVKDFVCDCGDGHTEFGLIGCN